MLRKENGVKLVKKSETPVGFGFFFSFHNFAILTLVGTEISYTPHLNESREWQLKRWGRAQRYRSMEVSLG